MNALQIKATLIELGFYIDTVSEIDYGQRFRLGCGAVISIYDKGTVLVQGKLHPQRRDESLRLLKLALPSDTRWCVK